MQTFLPCADFAASAAVLDPRRLGKQRVEALQVLRALHVPGHGWRHHPAARMWRGHTLALARYGLTVVAAWTAGGRADTCGATIDADLARFTGLGAEAVPDQDELGRAGLLPPWLGDEAFHRSHQSNLVRKDPAWYRRWFPDVPSDLPYLWPVPPEASRLPGAGAPLPPGATTLPAVHRSPLADPGAHR